jgi:hypothetical protein
LIGNVIFDVSTKSRRNSILREYSSRFFGTTELDAASSLRCFWAAVRYYKQINKLVLKYVIKALRKRRILSKGRKFDFDRQRHLRRVDQIEKELDFARVLVEVFRHDGIGRGELVALFLGCCEVLNK